jgi:hypothetical protein
VDVLDDAFGRVGTAFELPIISITVVISGVGRAEFGKTADCQRGAYVERVRHPNYSWFAQNFNILRLQFARNR